MFPCLTTPLNKSSRWIEQSSSHSATSYSLASKDLEKWHLPDWQSTLANIKWESSNWLLYLTKKTGMACSKTCLNQRLWTRRSMCSTFKIIKSQTTSSWSIWTACSIMANCLICFTHQRSQRCWKEFDQRCHKANWQGQHHLIARFIMKWSAEAGGISNQSSTWPQLAEFWRKNWRITSRSWIAQP